MGGTRSVRLKRAFGLPFLALLMRDLFSPQGERRSPGCLGDSIHHTGAYTVVVVSCLQKEAAILGQVLSRVLDSRVHTTSSPVQESSTSPQDSLTSHKFHFPRKRKLCCFSFDTSTVPIIVFNETVLRRFQRAKRPL